MPTFIILMLKLQSHIWVVHCLSFKVMLTYAYHSQQEIPSHSQFPDGMMQHASMVVVVFCCNKLTLLVSSLGQTAQVQVKGASLVCLWQVWSKGAGCYNQFSSPVGTEQRWFGGWRDLDYSAPRVQWLHTLLRRKAEAQGARPSKPKKKGMCPIGNSRGIAVQVQTTSVRFGQGVGHHQQTHVFSEFT